jgi:hypothetical protein
MKLSNLVVRPVPRITTLFLILTLLFACVAGTNAQEWASAARQEGLYASWSQHTVPAHTTAGQPISIDQAITPSLLGGQVQAVNFIASPQNEPLSLETIPAPQGQPIISSTAPSASPTPENWLSNGNSTSGVVSSDATFGGMNYGVTMGGPLASCGSCGGMGCTTCGPMLGGRPYTPFAPLLSGVVQTLYCGPLQNMTFHAGAQGFTSPLNPRNNGNFGFYEGFQYARGLDGPLQIGFQGGLTGVQSNFTGGNGVPGNDDRSQLFWTAGLFHRGLEGGLQWSIVYDGLSDKDFNGVGFSLGQIRTEIGFSTPACNDFGFYGAFNTGSADILIPTALQANPGLAAPVAVQATIDTYDIYSVYYRRYWCEGGVARIYAGATNYGNGVLGVDAYVPLSERCGMTGAFTCIFDGDETNALGDVNDSWNVGVGLEYSFGSMGRQKPVHPFRPTLNVADNGSMMTHIQ